MIEKSSKITPITETHSIERGAIPSKRVSEYIQLMLLEHLTSSIQSLETTASKKIKPTDQVKKTALPPITPKGPGSSGGFDPSVPKNYHDLLAKLQAMLTWIKAHPGNINGIEDRLQFLINLMNPALLKAHPKLAKLLESLKVNGESLITFMSILAIKLSYASGDDATAFAKKLLEELKDNPELKQAYDTVKLFLGTETGGKFEGLDAWEKNNPIDGDKLIWQLLGYYGSVLSNGNMSNLIKQVKLFTLHELLDKGGNVTLAIMMWFLLQSQSNVEADLGGLGDTGNFLSDSSNLIQKIINQFSGGNFDSKSAKEFMQLLYKLKLHVDNYPPTSEMRQEFDKEFNKLVGIKNIGKLFNDGDYNGLAGALDGLIPAPGEPPSGDYEQFLGTLKQFGNSFTNQQQTINIQVSQESSLDQTVINTFKGTITGDSGFVGLVNAIIKNQLSR